jgi:hypothetical protein
MDSSGIVYHHGEMLDQLFGAAWDRVSNEGGDASFAILGLGCALRCRSTIPLIKA